MKQKKKPDPGAGASSANPDLNEIEQLLGYMAEHNLEEFEYSRGDLRIRLKKPAAGVVVTAPRSVPAPEIVVAGDARGGPPTAAAPSGESHAAARGAEDLHLVKSPIVGTFYEAPSPRAGPFVKVGDSVEAGQTLCIIEAMKLMNEIESDVSGEVIRIFAENGQPVEYGQPLFAVRPSRKK